jgi:hypothetical protein
MSMLELVQIAADRWAVFEADEPAPRGYIDGIEALAPAGLPLYIAQLAGADQLGVYKTLEAAVDAIELGLA